MKKSTVELIEKTFKNQFDDMSYKIRQNKKEIKRLADEQRRLKDVRKGLFEILSQIRGYK
jgi:hypothetical protein